MKTHTVIFAAIFLWGSVPACRADVMIDPIYNSGFGLNGAIFAPIGQSFTADVSQIERIGMFTSICNCTGMGYTPVEFQLNLLNGSGTEGGSIASSTSIAPWGLYGFLYFDFSGTQLVIGNTYTAVFSQITPNPPPMGGGATGVGGTADVYSGGAAFWGDYLSGGPAKEHADEDFYLRVLSTDEIPPIGISYRGTAPEPSSLLLLLTALLFLCLITRGALQ